MMSAVNTKSGLSKGVASVAGDHVTMEELKAFAKLLRPYLSRDEEDREGIASMASIAIDPDATDDEIEGALETLREGLYPTDPVDLEIGREPEPDEENISKLMDLEEETFANRLDHHMKAKGISQVELAAAIGVGQPAISMMLSRDCRPQRRTVEKLAMALGVPPNDLWPGFGAPDNPQTGGSTHRWSSDVFSPGVGRFDFLVSSTETENIASATKTRIRSDALEDLRFPTDDTPRPVAA